MKSSNKGFTILGLLFLLISFAFGVKAQTEIAYSVSFPNIAHHEAEISFVVPNVPSGPFVFRMSRSSTGRYATHEFGKNIYHVKAVNEKNEALNVVKTRGDVYQIDKPSKTIKISYTLFGNFVDGTYAAFDRDHAHMNIAATFMYPVGFDNVPRTVQLNFTEHPKWSAVTQLKPLGNNKYWAKDFQYFMDSPINIGHLKTNSFEVSNQNGQKQMVHLVSNTMDEQAVVDNFGAMIKKMVEEQKEVFGEYPIFDYGHYYFMHNVNKDNAGDGMEHRNSTVIVQTTEKIQGNESNLLGTFSHEFFHAWNVERLRPKSLEPFKFEHANVSDGLWFAEGFTQYYGNLLLTRSGFRNLNQTSNTLRSFINSALNTPGALDFSPIQSSEYAVFADAAFYQDETNRGNIFTSYYIYGAAVALALDLRLRADFDLTLDHYMRALWHKHGKTEVAFTMDDLQKVLADLTKNQQFAANFFKNYIHGNAKEDYVGLLAKAGFVVEKANPGKAFTGFGRLDFSTGKAVLGTTVKRSPAYIAGLNSRNAILKINDQDLKSQEDLNRLMASAKPGDKWKIHFEQRGNKHETILTLIEDPALTVTPIENKNQPLTKEAKEFRDKWLNTQVK